MEYKKAVARIRNTPHHELAILSEKTGVSINTILGIKYVKDRWPRPPIVDQIATGFRGRGYVRKPSAPAPSAEPT